MCGYPCGCNYGGTGSWGWIIIVVLIIFFVIFWGNNNNCCPNRCNN